MTNRRPIVRAKCKDKWRRRLGIGFTLGPLLGGFVGKRFGPDGLFFLYAAPQFIGLFIAVVAGAHRHRRKDRAETPNCGAKDDRLLRQDTISRFVPGDLPIVFFLVGVTRVAFPFLAVNQRGMNLQSVGLIVSISRLTDTFGRYLGGWLCDRIKSARVILLGVAIGVPMFLLQVYGSRLHDACVAVGDHDHGFRIDQRRRHYLRVAIRRPGRKRTQPRYFPRVDFVWTNIRTIGLRRTDRKLGYEGGFQTMALISAIVGPDMGRAETATGRNRIGYRPVGN